MNWALIKNYFPCSICLVISSLVRNDRSNLNSSIVLECSNSNVLLWWLWSLIWFSLHIYNQQSLGKNYTSSLFRPLSNLFTFFFSDKSGYPRFTGYILRPDYSYSACAPPPEYTRRLEGVKPRPPDIRTWGGSPAPAEPTSGLQSFYRLWSKSTSYSVYRTSKNKSEKIIDKIFLLWKKKKERKKKPSMMKYVLYKPSKWL